MGLRGRVLRLTGVFGDFQHFVIVDRIGATLELLPAYGENGRPTAQRHAFLTFRTGSDVAGGPGLPDARRAHDRLTDQGLASNVTPAGREFTPTAGERWDARALPP